MPWTSRIAAQHSALWGFDRWYRLWWYIWPASLALLISGWICIDKPGGAAVSGGAPSGGSWGKPVTQNPVIQNLKVTPVQQPNGTELELVSCFANRPVASETACTRLIDAGQLAGQRLAAVYTQRGYLQRERDPARALVDYDTALRIQPGFAGALDNRAWIYMTRGEYDAALQDLNKAIDLLPPTSAGIARYYRGFAFLRLNNYPQALADLNEAQRLQPNNADIYLARGDVEQAQENYDAALRDFDEFSKRAPKDARGPISRGSVLDAMGRSQEALSAFEGAVALEPGNASALAERDRLRAQQSAGNQRNEKPK
jgi:tetratricopeptide (TPR) repeat protein